jgi:DNA-binding IclR family transcriptional regulator
MDRESFIKTILTTKKMQGINAMSISDITSIPRATVIRKLKILVKNESLTIDDNKHYRLTGNYLKKNFTAQKEVLFKLANFAAQVFNLKLLEKKKTI